MAQAGKYGAVTIATNMAGRGTDIMLGRQLRNSWPEDALRAQGLDPDAKAPTTCRVRCGYAG